MPVSLHRRGDTDPDPEAGVTLIELVVAMAVSMVICAMALFVVVDAGHSTQTAGDSSISGAQARNVLQSWTSYLQVADGPTPGSGASRFEWLTGTDVLFHAGLGNRNGAVDSTGTPRLVRLRLYGTQLVEEQFTGDLTYPKSPSTCRILADHVSATPLFAARDAAGNAIAGSTGMAPATSTPCASLAASVTQADPTTTANLETVATVTVTFTVTDARGTSSQGYTAVAQVPALAGAA